MNSSDPLNGEESTAEPLLPFLYPPPYYEGSPEYFTSDEEWMMHSNWDWMYSPGSGLYYHVESGQFYYFDPTVNEFSRTSPPETISSPVLPPSGEPEEASFNRDSSQVTESFIYGEETTPSNTYEIADEDENYFFMDFDRDIYFYSAQLMSNIQGKTEREDRHVSKEHLDIEGFSESQACCLYTAIFDGHGGAVCAEYCVKHLRKNLLLAFQHAKETIRKKLAKHENATGTKATLYDLGLAYSNDVEALRRALYKTFEFTDKSYLAMARKKGLNDGCTALVVLLYGPDDDGTLKVLTAHVGDCRAVICREGIAIRLTEDHKPNRKDERSRIEALGGKVVHVRGVWRVTSTVGNKIFGLSTARSIGDYHLKVPRLLVPSTPDLRVHTVDFYRDLFLVLGSDGIWDVLSDQEACDIVSQHADENSPQAAADALVTVAAQRGSTDDKTATVVYFAWKQSLVKEV